MSWFYHLKRAAVDVQVGLLKQQLRKAKDDLARLQGVSPGLKESPEA